MKKNQDEFTIYSEIEEEDLKKSHTTFGTIQELKNKNFSKSNNFLHKFFQDLDINEVKIINSLLYLFDTYNNKHKKDTRIQEHFKNILYEQGFFKIYLKDMLKLLNSNRNLTLTDIDKHLENIRKKSLRYKKIVKVNDKTYVSNTTTSFLYKFITYSPKNLFGEDIKENSFMKIYIDKELYTDIFKLSELRKIGGYTKDFNIDMNKLSSRLGLGLYEELTRITPLKNVDNVGNVGEYDYIDDFTYTLKELNEIFGTDFKYLAHMKQKIETQYKKLLKLELIKDIYNFNYGRNDLKISIKRNILKEMYEKEGVIF